MSMKYRKARKHERASLAMSGAEATLIKPDEMGWLCATHLPEVPVCAFHCAVMYGSEGAPTQIELYEEPVPSVMAWPEIWILGEEKKPIIIEHFRKKPDGYLASLGCETIASVFKQIKERLVAAGMVDEYFSLDSDMRYHRQSNEPWPSDARWVVCFPVVGGSEGHYIHVEALWSPDGPTDLHGRRRLLMLGKTFQGWDHAWKMAMFIAGLLEDASWGHVEEEKVDEPDRNAE